MSPKTNSSDHDLIVRIDERQAGMATQLNTVIKKIDCMVPNDNEYQELKIKVDSLWDSKNKMIGWLIGAGIGGGGIGALLTNIATTVIASFK
jgi:hypothetical protein